MTATSIAAGLAALLGSAYLVDYELGIRHDLKYAKAGEKTLKYLLEREAEGKASVVEPFITTARGPDADREFLVFEDYSASFRGADIETNRLAQLLVSKGVKPGDVVAICFENSPQAVYAQLAVWKCGAAVGFLNHNLRGNNLLHTFKLGKGKHLLFEDRNMEAVESIAGDLDKGTVLMCYGFSMPKESQIPSAIRALDFVAFDAGRLEKEFPDGKLDVGLEVRKSIRLNSFSGIYYTSGVRWLANRSLITGNPLLNVFEFMSLRCFAYADNRASESSVPNPQPSPHLPHSRQHRSRLPRPQRPHPLRLAFIPRSRAGISQRVLHVGRYLHFQTQVLGVDFLERGDQDGGDGDAAYWRERKVYFRGAPESVG